MVLSNKQRIAQAVEELKPALLAYVAPVLVEAAKSPRKADIDRAMEEAEIRMVEGQTHWDVQALIRMMIKLWVRCSPVVSRRTSGPRSDR